MRFSKLSTLLIAAAFGLLSGIAGAKLPLPSPEAQAKAEEAKTKAATAAEVDKANLAKAQDRVAARYIEQQKAKGVTVKPTPVAAPAAAATPASSPQAAVPNPGVQKVLAPEGGTRQSAEAHSAPANPEGEQSKDSKAAEKKPQDDKPK
ncbi:MAG: hypothetical protein H7X91_02620 [Burkholderiales bacterium]|nr:hypothetical protein [Burkholderiales bacterium]